MPTPSPTRRRCRPARAAALALGLVALLGAGGVDRCQGAGWALYGLGKGSRIEEGCFDPCLCPLLEARDLRGALLLEPADADPADPFRDYRVTWLAWLYQSGDGWTRVTGSGSYRVGGEVAPVQQLSLDLRVGDEPVQHYDSGLVAGGADGAGFPPLAIAVSRHGRYCYDRVFTIVASPL